MRQEALSPAYHKVFHSDNIEDLIRMLIAVGKMGRNNIESLELPWESRINPEWQCDRAPDCENPGLDFATSSHEKKCAQLAAQGSATGFASLRLYFDSDLITNCPLGRI